MPDIGNLSPQDVRALIRNKKIDKPTSGMCKGHIQANLVIVPKDLAYDFLLFAQRNSKPCPVLDVTDIGSAEPKLMAKVADLRTDLSRYRIYQHGELVDEVSDLTDYWRDDLVCFLLGCSFSFETAMLMPPSP